MSDVLFPELPGLEWDLSKSPIFNTKIMTSINGRELRSSYQAVPKYEILLSFGFLRESKGKNELQQLESFFIERRGAFDSFLFKMPDDYEYRCTFHGDGFTTTFQIYKNMNQLQIPVSHTEQFMTEDPLMWDLESHTSMWTDDVEEMWFLQYGITKNGFLTFPVPLEDGETLTVSGTYYYRCRFMDDTQQYTNFMHKLWKSNKVEMIGSLGNKI